MTKLKDTQRKIVKEVNGLKIVRCECKKYDAFTGKFSGHTKVFYDVCNDETFLNCFKTLKEAEKYAREL